jgi:hypothetical protein
LRCCRNHHAVASLAISNIEHRLGRFAVPQQDNRFGAVGLRQLQPFDVVIEHNDPPTGKPGKLRHELAHEAGTQDGHEIAQLRANKPHRVQRNRTQRAEAGLLCRHIRRYRDNQVFRYDVELGMIGNTCACHGNKLPNLELSFKTCANLYHRASRGVAERQRLIEPRQYGFQSGHRSIALHFVEDLAN